jgi:hypothetical protein
LLGLLLTFSRRLDQDAYLGLLAVMAALKPFEMENHRDRMITVLSGLFYRDHQPFSFGNPVDDHLYVYFRWSDHGRAHPDQ